MARRRRSTSTAIVRTVPVRAPAPVIRLNVPRSRAPAKVKHRRRHAVGGGAALSAKVMLGTALGGAVLGYVDKNFGAKLPTVPMIGRKGTIAVIAYFLAKKGVGGMGGIMRDVALAAAAVSGYELGNTGKISGVDGELDGELDGLAAQV
jgi:hypothetical protein